MPETSSQGPVILYFYTGEAPFIQKDIRILRGMYRVHVHVYSPRQKWKTPWLFLSQLAFLLRYGLRGRYAVVVQFAGYHSLLPVIWARLAGRASMVVVGGTDCVSFPSLGYGHFQNPLLAWFSRASYRWAHTVSAVHSCLFHRDNPYAGPAEREQGIDRFAPGLPFRRHVSFNGFDTRLFTIRTPWKERPAGSFITISGALDDDIRVKLKGIDLVLDLARKLPEARFTLIGSRNPGKLDVPPNVTLLGYVENDELPEIYNRHQVYLQLSLSEGFPNALCEAMACGCIPVVSAVASMPEIVDGNGLVLERKDPALLLQRIREEMPGWHDRLSRAVSESVHRRYPIENRIAAWKEWVDRFGI